LEVQKIVKDRSVRIWYAGLIIIAANAGGAWSPIGDVTTTMLWIGKKVTTGHLIGYLLLPSFLCMAVPTLIASYLPAFRGDLDMEDVEEKKKSRFSGTMLYLGLGAIIFVPIFKVATHLPPYVGMMLSLGIVAIFAEIYSSSKFSMTDHDSEESDAHAHHSPVHHSLSKIELPSILFFLGILMAVAALESLGIFCRNRRKYVNHWICSRSSCYGYGKNRFFLVLKENCLVSSSWFLSRSGSVYVY